MSCGPGAQAKQAPAAKAAGVEPARPAPATIVLTLVMAGAYEAQPGFLTLGGPDRLVSYSMAADTRAANLEEISRRFGALYLAKPGSPVHLIVANDFEPLSPSLLAEVDSRLRAAGFTRIDVSYEALEGKPLN